MQARRLFKENNIEVWVKQLKGNKQKAIAILNRGDTESTFTVPWEKIGVGKNNKLRDLWLHKDLGKVKRHSSFKVPRHGIVILKAKG